MQYALPGSLLVHAAVLGIALIGFAWPKADDAPAAEAVSVSIVSMSSVSATATELVQSDSTVNLVSSGAGAVSAPVLPEVVEPIETEVLEAVVEPLSPRQPDVQQPVATEAVVPTAVEAVEPIEPEQQEPMEIDPLPPVEVKPTDVAIAPATEVAILSYTAVSGLPSQPLQAAVTPALEPVSSQELKVAPVPRTLSFERPSRPTEPKPAPQQQTPRPPAPQPSQAGNGGANEADAVASAGSPAQQAGEGNGGDAEVARYPSQVLSKLRRALRSGNGPSGEVVVRFTVSAGGQVSGISVGRSSGNAAVDQAGLATVSRAAPFPPIPPQANRSSWTFDVPLAFGG